MADLIFKYGAMASGKSADLLQKVYNRESNGMYVYVIKPSIDTKGDNKVVTRMSDKLYRKVDCILTPDGDILDIIDSFHKYPDLIIIDEAQFLTKDQVNQLYLVSKSFNIPVICYGLRADYRMEGFEGSTRLLQIADDLIELEAICECGKIATNNMKLHNNIPVFEGKQIEIDGENAETEYRSVCGNCYIKYKSRSRK